MNKMTSTILVHRPERILYYLPEVTKEENEQIAKGHCPDRLKEYLYVFGTYDEIGVFYLPENLRQITGKTSVAGIEFRKDDERVIVPQGLESVILPAADMISSFCKNAINYYHISYHKLNCYNSENVRFRAYFDKKLIVLVAILSQNISSCSTSSIVG